MVKTAKKLRAGERKRLQKQSEDAKARGGVSASLFLEWEMNVLSDADCFFFSGSRLRPKGVLSVFFPDEVHAEFTAARFAEGNDILPDLFLRALEECKREGISHVHTVVNPAFGFLPADTKNVRFSYDVSEYMLRADTGSLAEGRDVLPDGITFMKRDGEEGAFHYALFREDVTVSECFIYPMPGTTQVYLYGLKTEEVFRRQGFATKLICEIAKDLTEQGMTTVRLQVSSENRKAESLYRKLGFETEEERKYYRTKEC